MRTTAEQHVSDYEYDAFGRLRKVLKIGTSDLVAEYRSNGLNQRITAHFDTDSDNDVDGSDTVSHFAYDSRWRIVARYEDANTDPTEQCVHHHAGLASSGSGSYIDSVILRDRDTTGNGTLDERVYYLQNWRSDVVALITDTGDQREQVRYEPYGSPFGIPAVDVDRDIQRFVSDSRWHPRPRTRFARFEDANTDPTEQWVYHCAGFVESGSSQRLQHMKHD